LDVKFTKDPIFGFEVPTSCPGVPADVLNPVSSWPSEDAYMKRYRSLASRFVDNFKKFEDQSSPEVVESGPVF
jgi:phosphoenolpyruvate carboxykinase (ATP)